MCLKSLFDPKKIVAKGCLETVDPDEYVGGRRLGSNWYGVQISVPIEWDEDLIRPFSNFSTIGEAVGNRVAWPHHLVMLLLNPLIIYLNLYYFMFMKEILTYIYIKKKTGY